MSKTSSGTSELLILTGMSGAGRSTVAHALEDLHWYVVDNLPAALLPALTEKVHSGEIGRLAVVLDVRGGAFFNDLNSSLDELSKKNIAFRLLFLDASDQALVQRFEATRRPHPLQGDGTIINGIAAERAKLDELRSRADVVIDTSNLNVHQLDKRIGEIFGAGQSQGIRMNILSFGYKYGIPVDSDLLLDCRFIPNPHWIPELRPLNGRDEPVRKAVLSAPGVDKFIDDYVALLISMSDGFLTEGKKFVTVAIGCTGGKHRSVAISEEIAARLNRPGVTAHAMHRDVGRE
ncbi:MAG: RNase adapter RapZ [Actinomycetes bacterium]